MNLDDINDPLPEIDLSKGVRGKYLGKVDLDAPVRFVRDVEVVINRDDTGIVVQSTEPDVTEIAPTEDEALSRITEALALYFRWHTSSLPVCTAAIVGPSRRIQVEVRSHK